MVFLPIIIPLQPNCFVLFCVVGWVVARFTDPILYIRGDGNVNSNNIVRVTLLQQLMKDYGLAQTATGHNTYHHFVGDGMYDSDIDILLHTENENVSETVTKILCKHDHPSILSHHDVILSSFAIPTMMTNIPQPVHETAPRVDHTRSRIDWSEDGQVEYCELVSPQLRQAREQWLDPSSQVSMSILLSVTSDILTKCATLTNKFRIVGSNSNAVTRSRSTPKAIRLATNKLINAHKIFKKNEHSKSKDRASGARESFVCILLYLHIILYHLYKGLANTENF